MEGKKKKSIGFACLFCIGLFFMGIWGAAASASAAQSIGVFGFTDKTKGMPATLGKDAAWILQTELMKNKNYRVVDGSQEVGLDKILIQKNGQPDLKRIVETGKRWDVSYILMGTITEAGSENSKVIQNTTRKTIIQKAHVNMQVWLLDGETGSVVLAGSYEGKVRKEISPGGKSTFTEPVEASLYGDAIRDAFRQLVDDIGEQFPPEGRIVSKEGGTMTLDIGTDFGVKVGQLYKVYRYGNPVLHPVTGKIIGREKEEIGVIKIIKAEAERSTAQIEDGLGERMQPEDWVRKLKKSSEDAI